MEQNLTLWPDDVDPGGELAGAGPNYELAVILLASGCTQRYVRTQCGFESARQCAQFCRDDDVRRQVEEHAKERTRRLGKRAMVSLEKIVSEEHTDLRAQVLAIRTALEVSGDLKRDHSAPVKTVRELTVPELSALIDATRSELDARVSRQRAGVDIAS